MPVTRVIIHRNGKIEIEGIGYVGRSCEIAMEKLLEILRSYGVDAKIEYSEKKPEYYAEAEETSSVGVTG